MIAIVKKYGRWNESCNWQLESRKELELSEEAYMGLGEQCGFDYSARYDEWKTVSEDKLRMTVVTRKAT